MAVTSEARTEVLDQLTNAFEEHALEEQKARFRNRPKLAEFHRKRGLWVLRALDVEERNPEPKPACMCQTCCAAYARGLKQ